MKVFPAQEDPSLMFLACWKFFKELRLGPGTVVKPIRVGQDCFASNLFLNPCIATMRVKAKKACLLIKLAAVAC